MAFNSTSGSEQESSVFLFKGACCWVGSECKVWYFWPFVARKEGEAEIVNSRPRPHRMKSWSKVFSAGVAVYL